MPRYIYLIIAVAFGCAPSMSETYWVSPDGNEVVVVTREPESETLYFNNDTSQLCYKYRIPGIWHARGEDGVLVSEDGLAGIALYSPEDLSEASGPEAITRASDAVVNAYEISFGTPLATKELIPFPSSRPGTMKLTVSLYGPVQGMPPRLTAHKVFVEIAPGWVAQISLAGKMDPDPMYRNVIDSLATTSEQRCYWPSIRRQFPNVR